MRGLLIFSLLAVLIACSDDVYYEQSFDLAEGQWSYDDQATFAFEIEDVEDYFDLVLDLKHSADYVFENVYVQMHTTFPSGETVTDEVSLQLADALDQWEGQCNQSTCEVSILLQNRVRFKEVGEYELAIEQYNRQNPLPGIESLTLKIIALP
ncbi:gliding motility lipoprotein GldH [Portibacter marinus]|uniref:gliding motility lipoprotein GldH n=1 Tax=Portibacter marinus TaxID=2898660 RepID=UPI001F2FF4CC|nr:gliding motility lipoprotein GldH [Portibacter marinus]